MIYGIKKAPTKHPVASQRVCVSSEEAKDIVFREEQDQTYQRVVEMFQVDHMGPGKTRKGVGDYVSSKQYDLTTCD